MDEEQLKQFLSENYLLNDAVVGYGEVEITEDVKGGLLLKLAKKYLPPQKVNRYWQELMNDNGKRVIIKIIPKWIKSWADRSEY